MLEGLLGGLSSFAKSGLGQAAIGAGLGYGADRLSGGKGGIGALAGGALGGLNALSSGGSLMGDAYTGSMADQAVTGMGGLLGGTKQNADQLAYNKQYMSVPDMYRTPAVESALEQGYKNLADTPSGMLGGLSQYGGLVKGGTDIANAYGSYQSNMANRDNTKAQMNYIQNLQRQQDLENEYQRTARASTQAGANAGFNNSVLGSSSNYYSA